MTIVYAAILAVPVLAAGSDGGLPSVLDARVSTTASKARLILDLSAPTDFAIATLANPNRIAVDVRASEIRTPSNPAPAGDGIVSGFRQEMLDKNRARTWLDLGAPAKVQQAYVLDAIDAQPARLVVDLIPATEKEFAERAEQYKAAAARRILGEGAKDATKNDSPAASAEPAVNAESRQSRPLVVIDPGHGGVDSGAESSSGIKEKNIALAFSKILQKLLVDTGKFDVALTRETDTFVKLEDRVALARANKADLFVSIHADYFQQEDIRGASIYTRDEHATDELDKVLADNENRSDLVAGYSMPNMDDQVVSILVDLMRREMRRDAYEAARKIVARLQPNIRLRRFPVRKANFYVLQAPDVPSILIELGFMSNAADIANLTAVAWRDDVAKAIAQGISDYFDEYANQ